jgi:hypothetical protein
MAYPYGTFNDTVVRIARECGLGYARGVVSTRAFEVSGDLLRFQPTCHHNDENLMPLAESFINSEPEKPQLFYLWGHSYEFESENNWRVIEEFCKFMSGRADIAYCTNAEAFGL